MHIIFALGERIIVPAGAKVMPFLSLLCHTLLKTGYN